jgi:ABC-type transport system involved in multi-copper enzyme maturation permease subunit
MLSFYNIDSIARYELRILLRSWFFRIFAILSLFIIGVYTAVCLFENDQFTWVFRSSPTTLIYADFFLLNIFQSIIAVFLATDFLKRDKKLDTSEVLFIRPMSNFEYVTGKTLGLVSIFVILDLLVVLLVSILILSSGQVAFRIVPMVAYFLLVSIPTLTFIIGLTYTIMTLVRNQSITFIILLGYIALVMFYLAEKAGCLFDYMVVDLPVPYSDIIGFGDFKNLIVHRISYFLLGIGLILFTIWRLKRKPNSMISNWILSVGALVTACVAFAGFYWFRSEQISVEKQRIEYSRLSSAYYNRPVPLMQKASIYFEQGNEVKARSEMTLKNNTGQTIDTLFFSINPGFKVEKVSMQGGEMKFIQDKLLVKTFTVSPMKPNDEWVVSMEYSGTPDFNVSYLDVEDKEVYGFDSHGTIRIDRRYGFYNDEYVLLTKENLWYPIPGMAYDPSRPAIFNQQFTQFDLTVLVRQGMLPVSQGDREKKDSLVYHFQVRDPLPQLSLNIAKFHEKLLKIGQVDMKLAYIEGHDFFKTSLSALGDTTSVLITEFLDDFERPLGINYPYPQFSLVEVPIQFASRPHSWTSTLAQSQPQMVFYPEWGFNVRPADFKSGIKRVKRDSERNKEGLKDKEIQSRVFTNFMKSVFTATNEEINFGPSMSKTLGANPYSIFPNYFYYVNYITSDECPVLNYAFESYLMKGKDDPRQMFFSSMTGISDDEKANIKLKNKSLKQIISENEDQATVSRVLKAKGAYLLSWMEKQTSGSDFQKYLLEYLYTNSYKEIKYNELIKDMSSQMNLGMGGFINDWYNTKGLPAFGIGEVKAYEVIGESQVVYLVNTKVSNLSNLPGLVKFTFMTGEGGRRGFGGGGVQTEPEVRTYLINANETKEIQILLTESPRSVIFNTLIAENIPSKTMINNIQIIKDQKLKAEEYEKVVDQPVDASSSELIVDNTDIGFTVNDPAQNNYFRKLFAKKNKSEEEKFAGQGFGPAPVTWSLSANSDYFGKTEHSALVVRSGDGNKTATWKKTLPAPGYYDVYVWLTSQRRFGPGHGRDNDNEQNGKYTYSVKHDDGVEKIELELKDFEKGWNLLGSFYLSGDTATVTLTDAGGADKVVADAVKWVLQR